MILTLVGLIRYTTNFTSKNQAIANTLLSWYINIENSTNNMPTDETPMQKKNCLESMVTTNFQVEKYLKQFMITNCHRAESNNNFMKSVEATVNNLNESTELVSFLERKSKVLQPLLYTKWPSMNHMKLFVLSPTRDYGYNIRIHMYIGTYLMLSAAEYSMTVDYERVPLLSTTLKFSCTVSLEVPIEK